MPSSVAGLSSNSMANKKSLHELKQSLAESEYTHTYLTTSDTLAAKTAYRKALGDLKAEPPEEVERRCIELRSQMLEILEPKIRKIKRDEWLEFDLLHTQVRRMLLKDNIAETGVPDKLNLSDMKDMTPNELDVALDSLKKLQEMRRSILIT